MDFFGKDFFSYCMFKKNFLGTTKFEGMPKNLEGTDPECPPWQRPCFNCQRFAPFQPFYRFYHQLSKYTVKYFEQSSISDAT